MTTKEKLDEIFRNAEAEALYQSSGGYDDILVRPDDNLHGIPELPSDRIAGMVLYCALTPENAEDFARVFAYRIDAAEIRAKLEYEADLFECQTLFDFCLDSRRDGNHEISDAAFDNASELMKLFEKDRSMAMAVAQDIVSNMQSDTAWAWSQHYDQMLQEQGFVQFEISVIKNGEGKPILYSHLNFECPYYRTNAAIAADCGPKAARKGLDMLLCAAKLDRRNFPKSCYNEIIHNFPALADMEKPRFLKESKAAPKL